MNFKILENLKNPSELKKFTFEELNLLSDELREALIYNISNTGGHLASNLGIVELTVAIHKVFDSPKDQIVFDVGHQCYAHKMLTGRFKEFFNLRKKNGISGFPNPAESNHDIFKTGHSSTSISSALGLACSNSISGIDSTTVAIIGDGSMTGGLAYEGLNNAGNSGKKLVVIINDNKMSISENVGSISKMLTKLRNKNSYFKLKDGFGDFISSVPCIGEKLYRQLFKLKSAVKAYFYSSNIFESMGFKYIGPIDGHNIELLVRVLERAKSLECPVVVHVKTKKGKGYSFAENKPHKFHGVSEFDIETGTSNENVMISFTDVFGKALLEIADKNPHVCAITAAMGDSCGLKLFKEKFPERYFDVGIAEQHAVTFAGGLAKNGMIPVFSVYSTFLQRAYDQIIHDVSLQNLKVIFAVDRAGFVGNDGETHQGLFDIPMLLPVPDLKIFAPSNGTELSKFLDRAINVEVKSVVVRYPKGNSVVYSDYPFKTFDDWEILEKSSDILLISYGTEIYDVLNASSDFRCDILKLNLINVFSDELLEKICEYIKIIFVEECYKTGGIGSHLNLALSEKGYKGKFNIISLENKYYPHEKQIESKCDSGISGEILRNKILKMI